MVLWHIIWPLGKTVGFAFLAQANKIVCAPLHICGQFLKQNIIISNLTIDECMTLGLYDLI